jgi:hypothetical protein
MGVYAIRWLLIWLQVSSCVFSCLQELVCIQAACLPYPPQSLRMFEAAGLQLVRICLYRHFMIAEALTFCRRAPDRYAKIRILRFFLSGERAAAGEVAGPITQGLRSGRRNFSRAVKTAG